MTFFRVLKLSVLLLNVTEGAVSLDADALQALFYNVEASDADRKAALVRYLGNLIQQDAVMRSEDHRTPGIIFNRALELGDNNQQLQAAELFKSYIENAPGYPRAHEGLFGIYSDELIQAAQLFASHSMPKSAVAVLEGVLREVYRLEKKLQIANSICALQSKPSSVVLELYQQIVTVYEREALRVEVERVLLPEVADNANARSVQHRADAEQLRGKLLERLSPKSEAYVDIDPQDLTKDVYMMAKDRLGEHYVDELTEESQMFKQLQGG